MPLNAVFVLLLCAGVCTSSGIPEEWPITSEADDVLSRVAVSVAGAYLPVKVDPSSQCGQAVKSMLTSLTSPSTKWARKMVDAWGKTNDGILYGNWYYLGAYDECVTTAAPDDSIRGQYCNIYLKLSDASGGMRRRLKNAHASEMRRLLLSIQPALRMPVDTINAATSNELIYSTCMPNICTKDDLQESLSEVLHEIGYNASVPNCLVQSPELAFTAGDISFITVVSLLLFLVMVMSLVDIYINYSKNTHLTKGPVRYLLPFSAYTNLSKMFHLNTSTSTATISCLHGMRVLSMTWIIYCHQMGSTYVWTANVFSSLKIFNGILAQVILNGYPSVDTFFFLSGLLVAYSLMNELKRTKRFNIILFYVHRLIRLLPALGLVAWMYSTVAHFFAHGPISVFWNGSQENCQKYWWREFLLFNNFMTDGGGCIGQSWYIAVDCQLYLIAPLLILPLYYFSTTGKVLMYLVTLASIITPAAITYVNDLGPTSIILGENTMEFFQLLYLVPWCRAGPWLVGILMGYIFHIQGQKKVKIHKWLVLVGWTVAVITGLLVIFGVWSYNTFSPKANYDIMTQVVYAGMHRVAWAAALAWVVYACHNGSGGVVNGFLSHPSWQPLSRLTYPIYLVAMPMQSIIVLNARTPYYSSHFNKVVETVGATFISGLVAVLVSLLAEGPIIGLEKLLLRPTGHSKAAFNTNAMQKPPLESGVFPASVDTLSSGKINEYPLTPLQGQDNMAFTIEVGKSTEEENYIISEENHTKDI